MMKLLMYRKLTNVAVTVMLVCTVCGTINAETPVKRSAKSLNKTLPERVVHLFSWPDVSILSGPNRVSGDETRRIALVKTSSIEWIKKVLNPTWLPMGEKYLEENLIMIRDEFSPFDVTRVQWTKNEYNIQVSQMVGIIAIKLTPLKSVDMGKTVDQKRRFAKELCRQIMNNTGIRHGGRYSVNEKGKRVKKPVKVTVRDLATKICRYSFRPELLREFSDGIVGVAATQEQEGLSWIPRDGNDIDVENLEDNPNWDKSRSSWSYWWRHVCWWRNGKSVGFFTLKKEAGSVSLDYWDNFGSRWFEGPPSFKTRKKE